MLICKIRWPFQICFHLEANCRSLTLNYISKSKQYVQVAKDLNRPRQTDLKLPMTINQIKYFLAVTAKPAVVKPKSLSYDDFLENDTSEDSKDPVPEKVFVAKVPEKTPARRSTSRKASQPVKPASQPDSDEDKPAEEKPETRRRSTRIRKIVETKPETDSEEEIVKESKSRKSKVSPKVSPKAKTKVTKKTTAVDVSENSNRKPVERRKRKKKNLKNSEPKKQKREFAEGYVFKRNICDFHTFFSYIFSSD